MAITYAQFSAVYAECINGRTFVEYKSYYDMSRHRFWEVVRRIDALDLAPNSRVIDIGGGIVAVLVARLFGFDAMVGDVNERARADVESHGLKFVHFDLSSDTQPVCRNLDLVVLTEVIEHIPQPPYLVLRRIFNLLLPGARLFLTTPNGHRFRNLVYMALGKEILDYYRYPESGVALGHQHEYTMKQMLWQAKEAGFDIESAEYFQDGFSGATTVARVAWMLARPVGVVPYMRNSIAMVLRRPDVPSRVVPQ